MDIPAEFLLEPDERVHLEQDKSEGLVDVGGVLIKRQCGLCKVTAHARRTQDQSGFSDRSRSEWAKLTDLHALRAQACLERGLIASAQRNALAEIPVDGIRVHTKAL